MKLTAVTLIILGSLTIGASALAEGDKVTICHAAGQAGTTHYETLTISENAVYKDQGGHFYENGTPQAGHEQDYIGSCLIDPGDTTSTTTVTESSTSTTFAAPTTTAAESTTTSSPTSISPSSLPESSVSPSSSTVVVELTTPVFPAPSTEPTVPLTMTDITTENKTLPKTGDTTGHLALIALGLTLIGGGATVAARRK